MPLPHTAINLRRIRLQRQFTQKVVAERAGIRHQRVSAAERGHGAEHPALLAILASALGVPVSRLLAKPRVLKLPPLTVAAPALTSQEKRRHV